MATNRVREEVRGAGTNRPEGQRGAVNRNRNLVMNNNCDTFRLLNAPKGVQMHGERKGCEIDAG